MDLGDIYHTDPIISTIDGPSDQKGPKSDSDSDADSDTYSDGVAASDLGEDWAIFPKEIPPLNVIPCTTCLSRHKRN